MQYFLLSLRNAPTHTLEDFGTKQEYVTYNYSKPMMGKEVEVEVVAKDGNVEKSTVFKVDKDQMFNNFLLPKPVDWHESISSSSRQILDFDCGFLHLLVLARDPDTFETRVYTAGAGNNGQLGHGDQRYQHALKTSRV